MPATLTKAEPASVRPWFRRGPLQTLREELEDVFSQFLPESTDGWGRLLPSIDLSETDQAVEVRMDVPGLKPEQIDIQLNNNVLSIGGQRQQEREEKGKTYHRVERSYGSFSRSIALPCPVKEDAVDAQYKDGVLTVTMQKTAEAKAKKIKVKG